jgi:pimeloyl-ACP methyl ester carboxylesterase
VDSHIRTKPAQACAIVLILLIAVACRPSPEAETQAGLQPTATTVASATPSPSPTASPTLPPTVTATPAPHHTVCARGCDFVTIQEAIHADSTQAGDIIQVADSIHTEAGILVEKDVIIRGQGSDHTTLQAHTNAEGAQDRVFRIASDSIVAIEGMTIRHGHPRECPRSGGGILNEGTLTLTDCNVSQNIGSAGGGLLNNGTMTLVNCTVSDNVADGHGGENAMGKGSGGGIKNMVGALTIINSTISGNRSARNAGGIKVSCSGTLDMVNSTVSGNHAGNNGGGLEVRGVVTLTHSTVAYNDAKRTGGGIYLKGTSDHVRGILTFANSVISDNTPGDCILGDNATIGANAHNLVGDGSCNPALSGDARLGGLADNGGQTQTCALLPGSLAIDAVPPGDCSLEADQRGASRPVELHSADSPCDLGAFEAQTLEDGLATQTLAQATPPPPTATAPQRTSYEPVFEKARCKPSFPPGYDIECGYLVVPEDRSQPDTRTVHLHVAIFHSENPDPAPDPVIHLVGGPGVSLLDASRFYLQAGGDRILDSRDYILFNQRGTRYAGPSLECPGQLQFGLELAEQQLNWQEREAREIEFLLECQEFLLDEGTNLAAYNSVENAADVADLRRALGYDQVNLYGISYGTKLALEIMRDHPEGIRSVILDSVYPLQVDINQEIASSAHRAFTTLFEGCASDAGCNATLSFTRR